MSFYVFFLSNIHRPNGRKHFCEDAIVRYESNFNFFFAIFYVNKHKKCEIFNFKFFIKIIKHKTHENCFYKNKKFHFRAQKETEKYSWSFLLSMGQKKYCTVVNVERLRMATDQWVGSLLDSSMMQQTAFNVTKAWRTSSRKRKTFDVKLSSSSIDVILTFQPHHHSCKPNSIESIHQHLFILQAPGLWIFYDFIIFHEKWLFILVFFSVTRSHSPHSFHPQVRTRASTA